MSKTSNRFSTDVRARAVRMVLDHEGDYPGEDNRNSLEFS
jgi:transposase